MSETSYSESRHRMVEEIALHAAFCRQEIGREALAPRVLESVGDVPRHEFVPDELRSYAYANQSLPIGFGKTISQPFIVALMTDLLAPGPDDRVLEIGTGLGYQAAVLARIAGHVYSVEIIEELEAAASARLARFGFVNAETRCADGSWGWPELAPFDGIIVTAAPDLIPPALIHQLNPAGAWSYPSALRSTPSSSCSWKKTRRASLKRPRFCPSALPPSKATSRSELGTGGRFHAPCQANRRRRHRRENSAVAAISGDTASRGMIANPQRSKKPGALKVNR